MDSPRSLVEEPSLEFGAVFMIPLLYSYFHSIPKPFNLNVVVTVVSVCVCVCVRVRGSALSIYSYPVIWQISFKQVSSI